MRTGVPTIITIALCASGKATAFVPRGTSDASVPLPHVCDWLATQHVAGCLDCEVKCRSDLSKVVAAAVLLRSDLLRRMTRHQTSWTTTTTWTWTTSSSTTHNSQALPAPRLWARASTGCAHARRRWTLPVTASVRFPRRW